MTNIIASGLRGRAPEFALLVNPLDSDARLALIERQFQLDGGSDRPSLQETIRGGIFLSPIDARFYSLMGIFEQQAGDDAAAGRFFDKSLSLLPTEIQALSRKFYLDVKTGHFREAAGKLEVIARRWPRLWNQVEPTLPALLANEEGREAVEQEFSEDVNLRRLLIGSLAKSPDTLPIAFALLTRWHKDGKAELASHINRVTARLIQERHYREAYLLFALTRDRSSDVTLSFLYNGDFNSAISGNPFDWGLRSQAGVSFEIVDTPLFAETRSDNPAEGRTAKSLAITFLDNPVRFDNVSETLRLLTGQYRLMMRYFARDLKTPRPLFAAIECLPDKNLIAAQELVVGLPREVEASFDFEIPPEACGLQRFYIFNENVTESWKNRYTGTLYLNDIRVERTGQ